MRLLAVPLGGPRKCCLEGTAMEVWTSGPATHVGVNNMYQGVWCTGHVEETYKKAMRLA